MIRPILPFPTAAPSPYGFALRSLALVAGWLLAASGPAAQEPGGAAADESAPEPEADESSGLDTVELENGTEHHGYVVETGGNAIRLEIGGGSRRIHKRDIASVKFHTGRSAGSRLEYDRVQFKDGHELEGEVELVEGGRKVKVTLPSRPASADAGGSGGTDDSEASRESRDGAVSDVAGGTTVIFPMATVRGIRFKDELLSATDEYYTRELDERIEEALADLGHPEKGEAARSFLADAGIYAIQRIREELKEAREVGDGAPVSQARTEALRDLVRLYELKELVPDEVQEAVPGIYEELGPWSTPEMKAELLRGVVPNYAEQCTGLLLHLIRDPAEAESTRAMAVDLLRRLGRNQALLNLYNESSGQLQLVAAVSLARNRILLGAPTLIEALSLERESLRSLAARTLREATDKDFRFRAGGTPAARQSAVERWNRWWHDHRAEIEKTALLVLREGSSHSAEWKKAESLWKRAHAAWEEARSSGDATARRDALLRAVSLLEQAREVDPTFVKATISLAVIRYVELEQLERAESILQGLVDNPTVTASKDTSYWVHLELANVLRLRGRHEKAFEHYDECVTLLPKAIPAVIGRADCNWLVATGRSGLDRAARQERIGDALEDYTTALELTEKALDELELLRAEDLPEFETLPFPRRMHNREVVDVSRGYEHQVVDLHRRIARAYALQGKHERAEEQIREGLDYLALVRRDSEPSTDLEVRLRNLLALTYERRDEHVAAYEEYRRVLRELDPKNVVSRAGVQRLRGRARPGQ